MMSGDMLPLSDRAVGAGAGSTGPHPGGGNRTDCGSPLRSAVVDGQENPILQQHSACRADVNTRLPYRFISLDHIWATAAVLFP